MLAVPTSHTSTALTIYQMVRNRLPFVEDTPANQTLLSNFTLEIMESLEVCFNVAGLRYTDNPPTVIDPKDLTRVGNEENYTVVMQSIIADILSTYLLLMKAGPASSSSSSSSSGSTFLKKAKAGSVEVEYDTFGSGEGGITLGAENLMKYYRKQAINRAAQLGCTIDICDDCSLTVMQQSVTIPGFIVVTGCDSCGG